jgi:hypothetical protein
VTTRDTVPTIIVLQNITNFLDLGGSFSRPRYGSPGPRVPAKDPSHGMGPRFSLVLGLGPWIWGPIEITQGPIGPIILTYIFYIIYFL